MAKALSDRFGMTGWASLDGQHLDWLLQEWRKEGGAMATIPHLRWLLPRIGKEALLPKTDVAVLVDPTRDHAVPSPPKARTPTSTGHSRLQTLLDLAKTSGMRFEEASLFRPHVDYDGKKVWIRKGTRGGRYRYLMVRNHAQGDTLRRAQELTTNPEGCMIPKGYPTFESWKGYVSEKFEEHGLCPDIRLVFTQFREAYITHRMEHLVKRKGARGAAELVAREVAHGHYEISASYETHPLRDESSHQSFKVDHFVPGTL